MAYAIKINERELKPGSRRLIAELPDEDSVRELINENSHYVKTIHQHYPLDRYTFDIIGKCIYAVRKKLTK
jgi:hypothetical protein